MTSVKRYPHLGGFVGCYSEYTFVREAVAGGTPRGTQDRTGVSFNRGYDVSGALTRVQRYQLRGAYGEAYERTPRVARARV